MNANEVSELHATMRQHGIPGVVAPEDPRDPAGPWRVYDAADPGTRRDVTAETLAAAAAARLRQPMRGFIIPKAS